MNDLTEPLAIAVRVGTTLDALGIDWLVGGSVASSIHGIPRATQDIDIVADLSPIHVEPLVDALEAEFYIDADQVRQAVMRRGSCNLIDLSTMTKVDVFVMRRDPASRVEMLRRKRYPIDADGQTLPLATPEDIILNKLSWYRQSGERSERQWRDVLGVIEVNAGQLDRTYLERQAGILELGDLLDEALRVLTD